MSNHLLIFATWCVGLSLVARAAARQAAKEALGHGARLRGKL